MITSVMLGEFRENAATRSEFLSHQRRTHSSSSSPQPPPPTPHPGKEQEGETGGLKVVSGWDVLSNSQVNLVCGVVCAVGCGWWGLRG